MTATPQVSERPPRFPRIPYMVAPPDPRRDDSVLTADQLQDMLQSEVVVEEKVDGANVSIHLDAHRHPVALGRSGRASRDRAQQLGRLQSWVSERFEALRDLLGADQVLYSEWLYVTHTVAYARLQDLLLVLDIWHATDGFRSCADRDDRCRDVDLFPVPVLFRGVLGGLDRLESLHGQSRFGAGPAEGLVIRREYEGRLAARAKWVPASFRRKSDHEWTGTPRAYNGVASGAGRSSAGAGNGLSG